MSTTPTLFHNARILTMDPARSNATAVLVRDDLIVAVGEYRELSTQAADAHDVDCHGDILLPAFIDAHCHLLAAAARHCSVDCSPAAVRSIRDIQAKLHQAAAEAGAGTWIRAAGYDESQLAEQRHPTRVDLDEAVPHHPVRLQHRSGHAMVLNSCALQLAGVHIDTAEPPGAVIDRLSGTGEPSGLLLEMNDVLDNIIPPLPLEELAPTVAATAQQFLAAGITSICDATHTNGSQEWALLARLQAEGHLPLDVTLMEGVAHLGEMPSEPQPRLRRGHVKIMLSEVGGTITPDEAELARIVAEVHNAGRDVATHAVEERAGAATIAAIEAALHTRPRPHRHHIEHAALLPEGAEARLSRKGITVVTQPAFIAEHGDRYLRDVPPEKHERLYPIADLLGAGVRVAASTDAPVASIDAVSAMAAAITRRTASGALLAPAQAIAFEDAARMWTQRAAEAVGIEARGRIAPGLPADLVRISSADGALAIEAVHRNGKPVLPAA